MNSLIHSIPSLQPDTVISILAGSIIATLVSYFTYRKSGDKLIQESKILKQQTQLILIALEQAGFIELKYEKGEAVAFQRWKIIPKGFDSQETGLHSIRNKEDTNHED